MNSNLFCRLASLMAFSHSRAYCPTGEGNGIDNSCGAATASARMPKARFDDPRNKTSWLSTSGDFHPIDRVKSPMDRLKSPVGFNTHDDWAKKHGASGESELEGKGWIRVTHGGRTLYANNDSGIPPKPHQIKALKDHAIASGQFDEVVFDSGSGRKPRVLWRAGDARSMKNAILFRVASLLAFAQSRGADCGRDGDGKFGSGNKCQDEGDGGSSDAKQVKDSAKTETGAKKTVKDLVDGDKVRLGSVKEVNTVLETFAEMANNPKNFGDKPPVYDLCKVSVPGTNLFCGENIGVDRKDMPQAKGKPVPGTPAAKLPTDKNGEVDATKQLVEYLKSKGMKVGSPTKVRAASLKATQSNMQGEKVAGMVADKGFDPGKEPIFVSKDGYVVDGHHRWAAVVGRDAKDGRLGDSTMNVITIDAPIRDILRESNKFTSKFGIARKTVAASAKGSAK